MRKSWPQKCWRPPSASNSIPTRAGTRTRKSIGSRTSCARRETSRRPRWVTRKRTRTRWSPPPRAGRLRPAPGSQLPCYQRQLPASRSGLRGRFWLALGAAANNRRMRIMPSSPWGRAFVAVLLLLSPSLLAAQTWGQVGERAPRHGRRLRGRRRRCQRDLLEPRGLATGSTFDAQIDLKNDHAGRPPPWATRCSWARLCPSSRLPITSSALQFPPPRPKNGGSGEYECPARDAKCGRFYRANCCKDIGYGIHPAAGERRRQHGVRPRFGDDGVVSGRSGGGYREKSSKRRRYPTAGEAGDGIRPPIASNGGSGALFGGV